MPIIALNQSLNEPLTQGTRKHALLYPFGSSDAAARDKASDQYRRFRNRVGAT
jgi:hypothetical protein